MARKVKRELGEQKETKLIPVFDKKIQALIEKSIEALEKVKFCSFCKGDVIPVEVYPQIDCVTVFCPVCDIEFSIQLDDGVFEKIQKIDFSIGD